MSATQPSGFKRAATALLGALAPSAFFLSRFFALLAQAPVMTIAVRRGALLALLLGVLNSGIVYAALGKGPAIIFLGFAVFPGALMIGLHLKKNGGIRIRAVPAMGLTWLIAVCAAALTLYLIVTTAHQNIWQWAENETSRLVDQWLALGPPDGLKQLGMTAQELKRQVLSEMPSFIAIAALLSIWFNFLITARLHPQRLSGALRDMKVWRAPEWLVWPTLASVFAMLMLSSDIKYASEFWVAENFFRVFMAIYALQGIAVFGFLFEKWKIRGLFRALLFIVLAWPLLPLLLAVGFFDLWFDFRKKFGQSTT